MRRILEDRPLTRGEKWRRWYLKAKHDPAYQERRRAQKRAEQRQRRDRYNARSHRWAVANRERTREVYRSYYARHIDEERARCKNKPLEARRLAVKLSSQKPESKLKACAKSRKRYALKVLSAIGPVDYAAVLKAANGVCGICQQPIGMSVVHIDHIIPLARGGSHTQDNLQLAHAHCNISKGAKLLKAG